MASRFASLTAVLAFLLLFAAAAAKVTVLHDVLANGTLTAETVSGSSSLDGAKLSGTANATSYEWWYFDVVSTSSQNESVTVVFYNAGPQGFPVGYLDGPLSVGVSGSFENGTLFSRQVPASVQAVITETKHGVEGDWEGAGARFHGSSLLRPHVKFVVDIDSPELGVTGKIVLRSRAPPRYTCGPDTPGQNELAFLHVGWANAVPDADAHVDLAINSTSLRFTGLGYHDKNWGLSPFAADLAHTYWGHARVGPYSVVFSDGLIPTGPNGTLVEGLSGTVARDGRLISVSCAEDAAVVRPWGKNSEYPPTVATGPPDGVTISLDIGSEGTLKLNVTNELVLEDEGFYQRFIGSVTGGLEGGTVYAGRVLYEQFKTIGLTGS